MLLIIIFLELLLNFDLFFIEKFKYIWIKMGIKWSHFTV